MSSLERSPDQGDDSAWHSPSARIKTLTLATKLPYRFIEPLAFAVDMITVISCSLLAGIIYQWSFLGRVPGFGKYLAVGALVFANVSAILASRGNYNVRHLINFRRQAREIIVVWFGVSALLLAVAFSIKAQEDLSRGDTLLFLALGLLSLIANRWFSAHFLCRTLSTGAFAERKIILIAEQADTQVSSAILELQRRGYRSIRTIGIAQQEITAGQMSMRLHTKLSSVIETARGEPVEEIFLLIGWQFHAIIDSIVETLSVLPISIQLLPDHDVARYLRNRITDLGIIWSAELKRAPLSTSERFFKRCFDIIIAATILVFLAPLMLLTALFVKVDSRGPIFFFQTRNGFNGRSFRIAKFRSMHVLEDDGKIQQVRRNDPRVTRLGRWLRRTNIDELPQLFNVLQGDMSLIGPRPHAAIHNTEYEKIVGNYAFRHHVKPGITGWAQVNGYRGETPTVDLMVARVELDLWYINNWSFWLDVKILFRTLVLGIQPTGY